MDSSNWNRIFTNDFDSKVSQNMSNYITIIFFYIYFVIILLLSLNRWCECRKCGILKVVDLSISEYLYFVFIITWDYNNYTNWGSYKNETTDNYKR